MRAGMTVWKWLAATLLVVGWALCWILLWQVFFLDSFYVEASSGLTVFTDKQGDQRLLWIGAGTGLLFGSIGIFFLVQSSVFRGHSRGWSKVWLVCGGLSIVGALSAPIVYPSARSLVIDERRGVILMERQWLYATTNDALPIDELARVNLRVQRRQVGVGMACRIATGLSLVREDRTWIEVPAGFDHEAVAYAIAKVTGAPLEEVGGREC